jgi:hypothetical protein
MKKKSKSEKALKTAGIQKSGTDTIHGITVLDHRLYVFQIRMGHLWSDESPIEPRKRCQDWDCAVTDWESSLKLYNSQKA